MDVWMSILPMQATEMAHPDIPARTDAVSKRVDFSMYVYFCQCRPMETTQDNRIDQMRVCMYGCMYVCMYVCGCTDVWMYGCRETHFDPFWHHTQNAAKIAPRRLILSLVSNKGQSN